MTGVGGGGGFRSQRPGRRSFADALNTPWHVRVQIRIHAVCVNGPDASIPKPNQAWQGYWEPREEGER